MTKNFTLDHLLQYHYNELDAIQNQAIEELIANNENFKAESESIKKIQSFLNEEIIEPSDASIFYILEHHKKSSNEMMV
jgi:hypothetical protein